ncbi:MAG: sulfur carrier protein ThiS [Candidatus Chlorobium antarcticum]|nr:sulfur carrier protein ThiS [Candidatus Chlorobium antarcticum]
MITIQLNGEPETLPETSALSDLLAHIGSDGKTVATLVNEQVVRPPQRAVHILMEGDRVEILVFAGGG